MFEFLGTTSIVQLISGFMHQWHQSDDHEEIRMKRLRREFGEKVNLARLREAEQEEFERQEGGQRSLAAQRQRQLDADLANQPLPQAVEAQAQKAVQTKKATVAVQSPTIAQISEGTGLSHEQIRQAMKQAEDQFVHWPHPEQPGMTRYAMREHADNLGLENWQPGVGF